MRALLVGLETSLWPQISAIIFAILFMFLTLWVYLPVRKKEYQRAEKLPLED